MSQAPTFRRECEQFVYAMLGATSDDACAYFACGECGTRWGGMPPTKQADLRFCPHCHLPCVPVPVDPFRPDHWIDGKPENHVDPFAMPAAEDAEVPEKYTHDEIGAMIQAAAIRAQKRAKADNMARTHIGKAIKSVQHKLARENIHYRAEQMRVMRANYYNRESARKRYHKQKREAMK